jgi:broad specificity phosphatase PhoE
MTTLYLVRHGLAEGQEGRAVGQLDPPLTLEGAEAVRRLAARWQGPPADALYASDLRRAADSARLFPWSLPVREDPRLREMSFGDWEGTLWREIEERDALRFEAWSRGWWTDPAPGGESYPQLADRVRSWLDEVMTAHSGGTVVAVAHGGSLRALLAQTLRLPPETIFNLRLDLAHVSGLAAGPRGIEVLFVNRDRFGR